MPKKRMVVVLGRDAFAETFPEQQKAIKKAAKAIADLIEDNYDIVITHSNGPQVGMLHTAMTEFARLDNQYTAPPMSVCSSLSQGYMGYDLQNILRTELLNRGLYKPVVTLITQVKVDPFDEAFANPTKVIGRYMTEEEAEKEQQKGNHVVKQDKGYRRIIASPNPLEIYEIDSVKALLEANHLVIASGGGGIPVLEQGTNLKGASAVIEKDATAKLLAEGVKADTLLFLTGVDKVYYGFGKPDARPLDTISVAEAEDYIKEDIFESGSMLPKIKAAIEFITGSDDNREAIIAPIEKALDAVHGRAGTHFTK
ncbi:carbamate kinase [Clostridium sp. KNHs205]|uniref:carbamate kinase n=1 Tax=Clostridium sp. KNHs205 TaxID=1449050 RepID=UPI00051B31E5|nr:carbamate kinase [Clostridium sp. KNHs205]